MRSARAARWYAATLVWLRWIVLAGCLAAAVAAVGLLPGMQTSSGLGNALSIVPRGAAPLQAERQVLERFHLPVLARTVIVVRDPHGLSPAELTKVVLLATRIDLHSVPGSVAGALPVANTLGLFPSSGERNTTALLYLYFPLHVPIVDQVAEAQHLAERYLHPSSGAYVGVTGATVAQQQQGVLAQNALIWVQIAAGLVIALVVGLKFRCIGAPIVALATAGLAYQTSVHIIGWAGARFSFAVPGELEPLIAVLVAGVATDYSIFFLSAFRDRLRERADPHAAARQAIAGVAPIVVIAGLSVVAGTATLRVADLNLFRQLGPGMALSVAVSMLAALLFLPALLACAGRAIFWPGRLPEPSRAEALRERGGLRRRALGPVVAHRSVAAVVLALAVGVLGVAAFALVGISVGTDLISDLPDTSQPSVAARQASAGFAPGIVAPTEILVHGSGLDARRSALDRLQRLLAAEPHVAGVVGPADVPSSGARGVLITTSGTAARYLLVPSQRPYGGPAIDSLHRVQEDLPRLLEKAGLSSVQTGIAGDTALSGAITTVSNHDLIRVGLVALAVLFVILALFLRALLAPLLLLAATLLSVLATLGLTTWVFQDLLDVPGLTFYVPFAVTVLLLSFGSDYNIFLVGRIWQLSPDRPFPQRILDGSVSAGGAIATAGITLSLSFALLAIVPLEAFREFAFAMVVGILLDSFVVRSVLVPALLALLGPAAGWPSRRLYGPRA